MNLNAQHWPIDEIEAARDAAEALLTDHKDLLPASLAVLLTTFENDMAVIMEDRSGTGPGDGTGTGNPPRRGSDRGRPAP